MVFLDEQNGWIGNDCRRLSNALDPIPLQEFLNGRSAPALLHTTDGGNSWSDDVLPTPESLPENILSAANDIGFYCGTWHMERITEKSFLLQWSCFSPNPGSSLYADFAYLTDDGGHTWRSWPATGNEQLINATTGWRLFPGRWRDDLADDQDRRLAAREH
jgi:hypothetical protein